MNTITRDAFLERWSKEDVEKYVERIRQNSFDADILFYLLRDIDKQVAFNACWTLLNVSKDKRLKKLFMNANRLVQMLLNFRYGGLRIFIIQHIQIGKILKNLN